MQVTPTKLSPPNRRSTRSGKSQGTPRPSRTILPSTSKYIEMVREFIQDLPDGVKFVPEVPEMFEIGYEVSSERD